MRKLPSPKKTTAKPSGAAIVSIIMGSQSDWPVMQAASAVLKSFAVAHEVKIVSAHRTPKRLVEFAEKAALRGINIIIAGAGGAAHLPGMTAALTHLPVLGVPVPSTILNGVDALHSIVQMPKGIPVATFAIGEHGAANAALHAVSILALSDASLSKKLRAFRDKQTASVPLTPKASA
jgi:5-(carboxyamino)imidazole ribonucleotide mutase